MKVDLFKNGEMQLVLCDPEPIEPNWMYRLASLGRALHFRKDEIGRYIVAVEK